MVLFEAEPTLFWLILSLFGILAIVCPLYYIFLHPLSRYPGPFLAKCTDIVRTTISQFDLESSAMIDLSQWRYTSANSGRTQYDMIALHEKYGPIVRTGPTTISISDPAYIPRIYGIGQGFHKAVTQAQGHCYSTD
jgi:hypothetical protein